jgi:hypothetical protein
MIDLRAGVWEKCLSALTDGLLNKISGRAAANYGFESEGCAFFLNDEVCPRRICRDNTG